jgi:GT2 family glycosyltransferase
MKPDFTPQWSGQIELTAPALPERLLDSDGNPLEQARVLIRAGGTPLGFIQLDSPDGRLELDRVVESAVAAFGSAIEQAMADPLWSRDSDEQPVTVVVCTHNRTGGAGRTLESLLGLRHQNVEIIVVDNAPAEDSTRTLVERYARRDQRVRYVREDRAGLSRARNRGLREAGGEFIAFTDDDVCVDPLWINGLLRGFDRTTDVACVTGLVASASLSRPAEQYFDRRVWWSSSCEARIFTAERHAGQSPMHPYSAGVFGTGANFAASVSALRALGGFDECLGAGSPTQGGEDLDMFVRLIMAGHALSYEPSALVWHEHRIDDVSLRRQMYAYGLGLTAYITKHMLGRRSRAELIRRLPEAMRYAFGLLQRSHTAASHVTLPDAGLTGVELRGMLAGPPAYLRARHHADQDRVRAVAP